MAKKLQEYTKEELIELVQSLKKAKKFGLVWEDKPEQVAIDCQTKLPVLQEVTDRAITKVDDQPTNLIIEGDNYHSLSTLNYTHAGKIDVIYIDPPYNTGNKDFIYNDHYVDTDDGFRHSKWLSFMSKRLELAKSLLAPSGVVFISIDDSEQAHLKLLCDDVFGEKNFITSIIWQRKRGRDNSAKYFSKSHEYLLVYSRRKELLSLNKIEMEENTKKAYRNPDNDPRGKYRLLGAWARGTQGGSRYDFTSKNGKHFSERLWLFAKPRMLELDSDDRLVFVGDKVYRKLFIEEHKGSVPETIWADASNAANAADEIKAIFGSQVFDTVKPIPLIRRVLNIATDKDSTVLDFFAGSGTTGHAVLDLNKDDGGKRKFIMCTNNENGIAENVTFQRINKVINGYANEEGIPANLRYFKTSFVDKADTTDQTRVALVARATDMIKIRENTFEEVVEKPLFKIYANAHSYSAIIFNPSVIDQTKSELAKLPADKPINVYIFSLANDSFESDFADLDRTMNLCPIPESILEVYKRIFTEGAK